MGKVKVLFRGDVGEKKLSGGGATTKKKKNGEKMENPHHEMDGPIGPECLVPFVAH